MKGMNFRQEYDLDAPLHLDRESIEELNKIIERNYSRAIEELGHRYDEAVEDEYRSIYSDFEDVDEENELERKKKIRESLSYRYRTAKSVSAKLSKDKYFNTTTLKDMISAPELSEETVRELKVSYETGNVRFNMRLQPTQWRCLTLETYPENNPTAREVFVDVRDWALRCKAPFWQRWWSAIKGYHWNILLLAIIILMGISKSPREAAVDIHIEHAHQLLEQGVSSTNQSEAIESILMILTEYVPNEGVPESESNAIGVLVLVLAIMIILSFLPRLVIGIGRGERMVKVWKGFA